MEKLLCIHRVEEFFVLFFFRHWDAKELARESLLISVGCPVVHLS